MTYRIANWNEQFETAETRKLAVLRWVPVPNKHDGLGFRTVAAQRNAAELFANWNLMLQLASKAERSARGILARDGRPLTPDDMAIMTGFPKDGFARALKFFSETLNWLVVEAHPELPTGSAVGVTPSVPVAQSAGAPADDPARPADDAGVPGRREGKGREEKDGGSSAAAPPTSDAAALIDSLKANPAYHGIDVRREYAKMVQWCQVNHKQPSKRRLVNWLNRVDVPISGGHTQTPLALQEVENRDPEGWREFLQSINAKYESHRFAMDYLKTDFAQWRAAA